MKINLYNERKAQLEQVQNVTALKFTQVYHEAVKQNGTQFNVDGANPLFVSKMVEYLNAHPEVLVKPVIELMKEEVDQALIEANEEAMAFIQVNKPTVESIEAKVVELSK